MNKQPPKTRRGMTLFAANPFMVDIKTKTRRVVNKRGDMTMVNSNTGEITANIAGFWEAQEVDSTKFVKLFIQGVKALKELSSAGTKVFEFLYLRVQEEIGQERVNLSFTLVEQKITPISQATFTRGMKELIEKDFIAPTPAVGLYWINPSFIWNGDRLAFVKEYRKASPRPAEQDTKTIDMFQEEQRGEQMEELESSRVGATRQGD